MVSHVQKLYQSELNNLTVYMKEKSFELSREKTCLMLFNNGENLKSLPQLEVSKHVALQPQKRDGLLGTGKGMEGRKSEWLIHAVRPSKD